MRDAVKRAVSHSAVLRRLAVGQRPRVVVLVYHDLRDDADFPNWLRIPVADFDSQLGMLRKFGDFITPDQAAAPERLPADRLHFLVTFDDGYLNNHRLALPVLAKHQIPALFFISTGPLVTRQPFWSDIVVTPIQVLGLGQLDLSWAGLGWFRFRADDDAARWDDIERVLVALKQLGNEDHPVVASVLARFQDEYRDVLALHLPRFAPLSEAQVREMAASPWCHIGAHGHHHRLLTRMDDADLAFSLSECRRLLENLVCSPVCHLAYPNGNRDARVMAAAGAAGYTHGYTIDSGVMAPGMDALAIPRLCVAGVGPAWLLRFQLARLLLQDRRTVRGLA